MVVNSPNLAALREDEAPVHRRGGTEPASRIVKLPWRA
jgi:hypothetical protein